MAETEIESTKQAPEKQALEKQAPEELVSEIDRTRAELARTIDEITDRVSPAKVARRTTDRVRDRISQVDPLIGGAIALAAVSVACYLIWRRVRK